MRQLQQQAPLGRQAGKSVSLIPFGSLTRFAADSAVGRSTFSLAPSQKRTRQACRRRNLRCVGRHPSVDDSGATGRHLLSPSS